MKVLIPDDDRGHWESLRRSLGQESELQISDADAETASHSVIARELRRILDGCPICDGGCCDHVYALLATLAMEKDGQRAARLKQFYGLLRQYLWRELLGFRDRNPGEDIVAAFAFRCTTGRVGIVTILCSANPDFAR
jgi:hypothetical protein